MFDYARKTLKTLYYVGPLIGDSIVPETQSLIPRQSIDLFDNTRMFLRVSNDAAAAHFSTDDFELRLDERNILSPGGQLANNRGNTFLTEMNDTSITADRQVRRKLRFKGSERSHPHEPTPSGRSYRQSKLISPDINRG